MRSLRPGVATAVAAGAMAVMTVVAASADPAPDQTSGGQQVPVATATAVCPLPFTNDDTVGVVSALTPEVTLDDVAPDGATTVGRYGVDAPLAVNESPGSVLRWAADASAAPVSVTSDGDMAPGAVAQQDLRTDDGVTRGRAGTACVSPGTDFWFVGGGADVSHRADLLLNNVDDVAAQVDVILYGPSGVVDARGGSAITVPSGVRIGVGLDTLAPGAAVTAVHVTARTGRVSAALLDIVRNGLEPRGLDWLPAAASPAESVLVPGLAPVAEGRREIVLVAPGEVGGTARLDVVASDGTFAPTGLDAVDLQPGVVTVVDLTSIQPEGWISVKVTADTPVVAGARQSRGGAGDRPDVAFLSGAAALEGPAAVVDGSRSATVETTLVVSAPDGAGSADLVITPDGGEPVSAPVVVAPGSTVAIPLAPAGNAAAFTAVLTPRDGSGPLYAARWITEQGGRGPLVTAQPLVAAPLTVLQRGVRPDLRTGLAP